MLSNYLCRRPVNVIIQKSSAKLVPDDDETHKDADVFLTKIGPEDYTFLDDDVKTDSGSSTEVRKIDQESLKQQQQIIDLNRKMEQGIIKANDELADQLSDIRALKHFV